MFIAVKVWVKLAFGFACWGINVRLDFGEAPGENGRRRGIGVRQFCDAGGKEGILKLRSLT